MSSSLRANGGSFTVFAGLLVPTIVSADLDELLRPGRSFD
jgi:hypothetical protein